MASNQQLAAFISSATGHQFRVEAVHPVAGGSRWRTLRIDNVDGGTPATVFAKVGAAEVGEVFEAERDGLELLRGAKSALRIPRVLACGKVSEESVLILEWIDLKPLGAASGAAFGTALAGLHRSIAECFGLRRDNFIGASVQFNR